MTRLSFLVRLEALASHEGDGVRKEKERLTAVTTRPANGLSFPVCLLDRKDHWMTSSACLLQPLDRHLVKEDVKEEEEVMWRQKDYSSND